MRKGHKSSFFKGQGQGEVDEYAYSRKPKGEKAFIATCVIGIMDVNTSGFHALRSMFRARTAVSSDV